MSELFCVECRSLLTAGICKKCTTLLTKTKLIGEITSSPEIKLSNKTLILRGRKTYRLQLKCSNFLIPEMKNGSYNASLRANVRNRRLTFDLGKIFVKGGESNLVKFVCEGDICPLCKKRFFSNRKICDDCKHYIAGITKQLLKPTKVVWKLIKRYI